MCYYDVGHLTKMAAKPIYGKNPLLWNQWTDFHELWYVAQGTLAHHILYKLWPWDDHDLFYGKVKFFNLGFYAGKCNNGNYCIMWPGNWLI